MCLITLAWEQHERYPLVLCANRDEFYQRPSLAASYWPDHPNVLAGRDLQAGGTWLGINRLGRLAALTNIRNPAANNPNAKSRGELVANFLTSTEPLREYCHRLLEQGHQYNGYNLLLAEQSRLFYLSNINKHVRELPPGIYALSNADLDSSWPKTRLASRQLESWLEHPGTACELSLLLNDRNVVADHELPQTGVSQSVEKQLSAQFIDMQDYGTRCATGVLVDQQGAARFCEQSFDHGSFTGKIEATLEHFWAPDNSKE